MPWKNGGGVTHQIAAHPAGSGLEDFDWRISMAEVASAGPFSPFSGVDRTLTLLEGAGIVLDLAGAELRLDPGAPPLAFPGEAPVIARPVAGPILDLNVMTRRGRCQHAVLTAPGILPAGTAAVVARGPGRVGAHDLPQGATLLGDLAGQPASGDLLAVLILPMAAAT